MWPLTSLLFTDYLAFQNIKSVHLQMLIPVAKVRKLTTGRFPMQPHSVLCEVSAHGFSAVPVAIHTR